MKNPILWLTPEQRDDACMYGVAPMVRTFVGLAKLNTSAPNAPRSSPYEYIKEPLQCLKLCDAEQWYPLPIYVLNLDDHRINDVTCYLDQLAEYWSRSKDVKLVSGLGRFHVIDQTPHLIDCPIQGDEVGLGHIIYTLDHHTEDGEMAPTSKETFGVVFYPSVEDYQQALVWSYQKNKEKNKTQSHRCYNVLDYLIRDHWKARNFLKEEEYQIDVEEPKRRFKCYTND